MENNIGELVRKLEEDYIYGTTTISKYVEFSQYENIEKIEAYLNSKHTSGDTDSLNREKPFFNIVTAACNIWYRATDIDRKNITIKAAKAGHYVLAFGDHIIAGMDAKNRFWYFLNEWGRVLSRYGSAVLKFIEKDMELYPEVIPWNRLITDSVDFESNPKIEKLWLTPAQLKKRKEYDQEIVEQLIEEVTTRKTWEGTQKDSKSDYIPIYEVHGELPLSYLTGKYEDENEFRQQMHVISFLASNKEGEDFKDYTLYSGKESKDPYMITHLIKEDGRVQSIGAVEHLFEAQWMVNHSVKSIKDQLDLASKLIFQTSDGNFVGQNVLSAIEQGDILVHKVNEPLTQVANNSHDISSLLNYSAQWQLLGKDITSTPDAMRGNTMPSGTAYRQVLALQQESSSLFEIMTENKGLAIEKMLREYVLPHLKKQMDTSDEVSAILADYQVTQLDSMFVPAEAVRRVNEKIKKTILSGQIYDASLQEQDIQSEQDLLQKSLNVLGNQRFLKPSDIEDMTWKEVLKDLEWDVMVEVTGEERDKRAVLETLSTMMQTIAQNPQSLQDPNIKMLFNKILNETGTVSPIEISNKQMQPIQPTMPVGGAPAPVGGSLVGQINGQM